MSATTATSFSPAERPLRIGFLALTTTLRGQVAHFPIVTD